VHEERTTDWDLLAACRHGWIEIVDHLAQRGDRLDLKCCDESGMCPPRRCRGEWSACRRRERPSHWQSRLKKCARDDRS
jgi:hypothetical protein